MKLIFSENTKQLKNFVINTQILGIIAQKATPAMMKSIFFRIAGVIIFFFIILGLYLPVITLKAYTFMNNMVDYSPLATHGISRLDELSNLVDDLFFEYNLFYNRQENWGSDWDIHAYKEIISFIDPDFEPSGILLDLFKHRKYFLAFYLYLFFFFLISVLYHIILCLFPIFGATQRFGQKVFNLNVKNSKFFLGVIILFFGYISHFILLESWHFWNESFFFNALANYFRHDFTTYFEMYPPRFVNALAPEYKQRFDSYIDKSFTYVTVFEQYLLTDFDGNIIGPNPDKPKPKPKTFESWLFQGKVIACIHYEYELIRYNALQQLKICAGGDSLVNDLLSKPYSCAKLATVSVENYIAPLEVQTFGTHYNLDLDTLVSVINDFISFQMSANILNGAVPTCFEVAKSWYLEEIRGGMNNIRGYLDFEWFYLNDRLHPYLVSIGNTFLPPMVLIEQAGFDPAHPFVWFFKKIGVKVDEMIPVNPDIPINSRRRRWIDGHNFIKSVKPIYCYSARMDLAEYVPGSLPHQLGFMFMPTIHHVKLGEDFQSEYLWAGLRSFDHITSDYYVDVEFDELYQDVRIVADDLLHTISPENIKEKQAKYFFQKSEIDSLENKKLEDLKVKSHLFFYTNMFDTLSWQEPYPRDLLDPELGVTSLGYDFSNHKGLMWAIMQNFTHSGSMQDVGYSNHAVLIYRGDHNTSPDTEQYTRDLFLIAFEYTNPVWMYLIYLYGYFDPLQVETVYLNRVLLQKVRHAMHLKCGFYHLYLLWPDAGAGYVQKLWYRIFHKIHMIYFSHIWGDNWDHNILNISIYTEREHKENCGYYLGTP
jgi:hypothetical protein